MAGLTPQQIDALIAKMKKYPYACSWGTDNLGPLSAAPTVAGETETKEVTLYETGTDVQAEYLTKNDVRVTIKTRDVEKAMELQGAFAKGDNIIASTAAKALTLVPITATVGEKTITFGNAFLQPGLTLTPGEDEEPNEVELVFLCKADATTGKPFTYA